MGEPHKDPAPMPAGPGRGPGRGHGPGFHGPVQKPKNIGRTLLRIGAYLKDDKRSFILVIVSVLLNSLLSIVGPVIVGLAIDDYITPGDYRGLLLISLGLLVIYILNSLFAFLQGFFMASVSERTVARMRRDLFDTFQTLPLKFFDQHTHGELMSRLTNDVDNVSATLNSSMTQFISGIITILGVLILMLVLSPLLTLTTLATVPLMFLCLCVIKK